MSEPLYFRHAASLEHDTGADRGTGPHPAIEDELARRDGLGYRLVEAPEED